MDKSLVQLHTITSLYNGTKYTGWYVIAPTQQMTIQHILSDCNYTHLPSVWIFHSQQCCSMHSILQNLMPKSIALLLFTRVPCEIQYKRVHNFASYTLDVTFYDIIMCM